MNKLILLIIMFFILLKTTLGIPDSFSWVDKIKIREPGPCGSNWSFSTIALLEGYYQKHKGVYIKLSEEMLLDCVKYNNGCKNGTIENALRWIKENGLMKEDDYPYKGLISTCKADPSKYIDMKVTGYRKLGNGYSKDSPADEEEMKEILYEKGPISIGINATPIQTYTSGILDLSSNLCPPHINHQAFLVGYGRINGIDYWNIKNSWGRGWGERGYFRLRRGRSVCGVNYYAHVADVKFG